jgi:O-antigen/teichoic acid export membrane protein
MTRRWDSIAAMRRFAHGLASAAALLFLIGIGSWAFAINIAIAALVLGTAAVACALFAWFRLEHLRELDRLGR